MINNNKVVLVLNRWITSDDHDTLMYCVEDMIPETRTDTNLLFSYTDKCNDLIKHLGLEKLQHENI